MCLVLRCVKQGCSVVRNSFRGASGKVFFFFLALKGGVAFTYSGVMYASGSYRMLRFCA